MDYCPNRFSGREVVVVGGARTPFAKAGTAFAQISAVELGVRAFQEAVEGAEVNYDSIDQVVIGNVAQPHDAANIARVIALYAGTPQSTPAFTVQRNCASGLESISQAAMQIASGQADVVVAGGTESMSQIPLLFSENLKAEFFGFVFAKSLAQKISVLRKFRFSDLKPIVALESGLTDPISGMNMGMTAERLVRDFGISREAQDQFALQSHQKALAARGKLKNEMTAVYIPPKFKDQVEHDLGPREGQSLDQLAKLKPYFDRRYGSVTVGNACPVTDGAAMLVLMSKEKAKAEGRRIWGTIKSIAFSGCEPSRMGLGPAFSSPMALEAAGLEMKDVQRVEINEAFAAQVLACVKAFESREFASKHLGRAEAIGAIDPNILNVNGGAIALGHPVGTSGTRLVLTLLKELERENLNTGLATLCIGGGQGGACVVERG
jgi:acetyl-CoA acetyltransferase family protein